MFKVRFHLGAGKFNKYWQIKYNKNKELFYVNPELDSVQIVMTDCKLVNKASTANKIYNGANKTVCAWVKCNLAEAKSKPNIKLIEKISYNPSVNPYWTDSTGNNIDGFSFDILVSKGKDLYIGEINE